jgi:hypothetical protein
VVAPGQEATRHGGDDVAKEIHALGTQIASLQAEVRRLHSAPLPGEGPTGWDDRETPPPSYAWLATTGAPRRAPVRVPRLPFELAFLAAAAALAGIAHLRPLVIAGVMGGSWLIVALAEWAGSRGDRLRRDLLLAAPAGAAQPEPRPADPAWFTPPVEHTLLARGTATAASSREESETLVARLPAQPEAETTVERRPGS